MRLVIKVGTQVIVGKNGLDLKKIGNPRKVYDFGKFVFRSVDFSKNKKNPDYLYVLLKESPGFGQFSDGELAYVKEVKNVDGDTIVQIVISPSFYILKNLFLHLMFEMHPL